MALGELVLPDVIVETLDQAGIEPNVKEQRPLR